MLVSFLCFQVWSRNKKKRLRKASVDGWVFQGLFIQYLAGQRFMLSFWGCRSCFSCLVYACTHARLCCGNGLERCLYRINTYNLGGCFCCGPQITALLLPLFLLQGLQLSNQLSFLPPSFYYRYQF